MNNNKNDEAALLGVFSKTSYITFGSADKPEEYVKKGLERSSFLGKQLATAPAKQGKTPDVFFEKKHLWLGDGDKYTDKLMYKDTQPAESKKKGFGTSDYSKRDEFSNTIRTAQYREQLDKELVFTKKILDVGVSAEIEALSSPTQKPEVLLYDLVFEKESPGKLASPGASKTHRDTQNKTRISHDRDFGGQRTVNTLTYQSPQAYEKSDFGRTRLVQDTFYRPTFGGFGDAS